MLLNKVKPKKLSVTCHKFGNSRFTLNATFTIQELHKSPSKKKKKKKKRSYTSFLIIAPSPISIVPKKKKKKSLTAIASGTKKKSDCHHTGSFSVALKGKKEEEDKLPIILI